MKHPALKHLAQADPVMRRLIEEIGPPDWTPRRAPVYQSLIHAVVHQQLHAKAAGAILGRFQTLLGGGKFPMPEAIHQSDVEQMRGAGLSRSKAVSIRQIAWHAARGALPTLEQCDQLTDLELRTLLSQIKGVGMWTVEMLLIFNLGRPDVLPVRDFGIRRGFQLAYRKRRLPEPQALEKLGRIWKPYRTFAAWYLWKAANFLEGAGW